MEHVKFYSLEDKVSKKVILILVILFLIFNFLLAQEPGDVPQPDGKKKLYLYFMGEEAGYEEYEWIEQADKYILRARGEITKPVSIITELMMIELDKEFRPLRFVFKGKAGGIEQEIESTVSEGEVKNTGRAGEQTMESTVKISPDALIMPNSFFSPYMILAKRAKGLKEKMTFQAYVVPMREFSVNVEPDSENVNLFHINFVGVKIELLTDDEGYISSLSVPAQMMEARSEKIDTEEPAEEKEGIQHEWFTQGRKTGKGLYNIVQEGEDILIEGDTQMSVGPVSLQFQFEEKLSKDWNLKEAVLKGKVNDEDVELRAKVVGNKIEVYFKEGDKTSEKQFPFRRDIVFTTDNPMVDNLLLIKKRPHQKGKKLYALTKSWGSYYIDEPFLVPVNIESDGEAVLEWEGKELRTERYFVNFAGASGGYVWADEEKILKISFPFEARDVYHQDFVNLRTKKIASPVITSDKYTSEDVTYSSGDIEMAGTLTIPSDGKDKHPAAVLISGSGPQDRNEDTVGPGGLKMGIFKQIAHVLSENGIAVLRYDDRGTGESQGSFGEAAQEDLVQDARAAVAYLRTREDIIPERIALVGHSEGGIIAPRIAAEDSKVFAIVLLAGTAKTGDQVLREQFNFLMDSMELPKDRREEAMARYEDMLKIIKGEPVDEEAEEKLKPLIEPQLKWLRSFVDYDPLSVLGDIEAKILIINGGKDKQVFPEHAKMLHKRLKKLKKPVTLKIFPDLNHLLVFAETGAYAEYAKQSMEGRRVSQELLDYLSGWLYGVLILEK
ncbi:MAG: alpha/beta fold hydrolase [Candidatus Aminicenantes bacterium]|nr:MAG: alpha/beta fold hydrolase [Candidatus Aminicenantes bacterium]